MLIMRRRHSTVISGATGSSVRRLRRASQRCAKWSMRPSWTTSAAACRRYEASHATTPCIRKECHSPPVGTGISTVFPPQHLVKQLVEMGFDAEHAQIALATSDNSFKHALAKLRQGDISSTNECEQCGTVPLTVMPREAPTGKIDALAQSFRKLPPSWTTKKRPSAVRPQPHPRRPKLPRRPSLRRLPPSHAVRPLRRALLSENAID